MTITRLLEKLIWLCYIQPHKHTVNNESHSPQATLEEADVHLAEVKKECCQFDRDIGKALRDKPSLMRVEKVIRYIEDRIKAKVK